MKMGAIPRATDKKPWVNNNRKTYLLRCLARALKVPLVIADATLYSSTGYVGADVETMVRQLIIAANNDVKAAERGIIYIDEIDKTSRKGENLSTTADPGHEGVQQSLLKLLEGSSIEVPLKGRRVHPEMQTITVDTSSILFIVGGAFEDIEKIIAKRLKKESGASGMGFGASIKSEKDDEYNDIIAQVSPEDLRKFGMLPELLGRVPVIAPLQELSEEQLQHILTRPRNALVKQYQELLGHDGVELEVTDAATAAIARKALARKTGARGLRGIMEGILGPVMYDVPDRDEDLIVVDAVDNEIKVEYKFKEENYGQLEGHL